MGVCVFGWLMKANERVRMGGGGGKARRSGPAI